MYRLVFSARTSSPTYNLICMHAYSPRISREYESIYHQHFKMYLNFFISKRTNNLESINKIETTLSIDCIIFGSCKCINLLYLNDLDVQYNIHNISLYINK